MSERSESERSDSDAPAGPGRDADVPWALLAGPLVAAEDALARLDERLRASPIRDGLIARMHYADACASLWIEGELVPVEDLVLHDAGADTRLPTPQLARARTVLQARRLIADHPPGWALEREGAARLAGDAATERALTEHALAAADETESESTDLDDASLNGANLDSALAEIDGLLARTGRVLAGEAVARRPVADADGAGAWRRAADAVAHLPPLLAAGFLWDRWERRPPVPERAWLGRQMAAAYLRERGKARFHLPAVSAGLRAVPWERRRARDQSARLLAWLEAADAGARASLREHDRLTLALAAMAGRGARRRASSRLPDLVALAAARPLITAATAARALGVTQRAARKLIAELGLRETTGRGRYQAWML